MSAPNPFLIQGSPEALRAAAAQLQARAGELEATAEDLRRLSADSWQGAAGDAFRDAFSHEPKRWFVAADAFQDAAAALLVHADTLAHAQQMASDCAVEHARGEQLGAQARAEAGVAATTAAHPGRSTVSAVAPEFVDPGQPIRTLALDRLSDARRAVEDSGELAARRIRAACDGAPSKPNWFSRTVGSFFAGAGEALFDLGKLVVWDINPNTQLAWAAVRMATGQATPGEIGEEFKDRGEAFAAIVDAAQNDPDGFALQVGKAMVDWDTWKDDPARALGHLVPDALLAVATAGTGLAAKRGLDGVDALGDAADAAAAVRRGVDGLDDLGDELADLNRLDRVEPKPMPDLSDINRDFDIGSDEWAQAVSDRYPTLTSGDVLAVHHYTTNEGYTAMNNYLRNPDPVSDDLRPVLDGQIKATEDALAKLPRFDGASTELWRGTDLPPHVLEQWQPGREVFDPAFTSSSIQRAVGEEFAEGKNALIRIEQSNSGVDVAQISHFQRESEVLFGPSTKFEVISRDWDDLTQRWNFQIKEVAP